MPDDSLTTKRKQLENDLDKAQKELQRLQALIYRLQGALQVVRDLQAEAEPEKAA